MKFDKIPQSTTLTCLKFKIYSNNTMEFLSTTAVLCTMSWGLPMTLTTHHGVQRLGPVKTHPPRFHAPVVKMSL